MRRREFLGVLGGAAVWPLAARAQQPKIVQLGYLKLTEPNGNLIHINVAQVTSVRSDTQIHGANAEVGLTSGKVQGVQENVEVITAGQHGEMSWIKLTEPNGNLIHINVAQVTSVRSDTQIHGANAEVGLTSGKVQGAQENVEAVMQLIAAAAGRQGKLP